MEKKLFLFFLVSFITTSFAQIGVDTDAPKSTLDLMASVSNNTKIDGIMIPRLKGSELKAKDAIYTLTTTSVPGQTSAIVYVTEGLANNNTSPKTINITSSGYYYFDGNIWQPLDLSIYERDGVLISNRTVNMSDKNLAFTSSATTGTSHFIIDGATFNINTVDKRLGIETNQPTAKIDVVGSLAANTKVAPIRARNMNISNNISNTSGNVNKLAPLMMDDNGYMVRQFTGVDSPNNSYYFNNEQVLIPNGASKVIATDIHTGTLLKFKFYTDYSFGNINSGLIYATVVFGRVGGFRLEEDWTYSGNNLTNINVTGIGTYTLTFGDSHSSLVFEWNGTTSEVNVRKIVTDSNPSYLTTAKVTVFNGIKIR